MEKIIDRLSMKHPGEVEYIQAVREVLDSIEDVYNENPQYRKHGILKRLVEPDKVTTFKVPWMTDEGEVEVNIGYRIQFNNTLGPYKGGLRFHPSVNLSILKFLAFEQIFKNSLTSLPIGGAKGGSDFNPKGKSDEEIMRFCHAFMLQLWKIIGPEMDIPAGDIGVGSKEIGYLYGMYKKLTGEHTGVLTGKGRNWGGSLMRPEATGFGAVYFTQEMLSKMGDNLKGKRVAVSGFGNVAWGAVTKINQLGGKVISISGPDGFIMDESGISGDKIEFMLDLRASNEDVVMPFSLEFPESKFYSGRRPWEVECDIAIPCATQNELNENDALNLVKNNCKIVAEGANMPCTPEAIDVFNKNKVAFAPGKAVNAGGVATSGLEMSQNAMKLNWTSVEVDEKLQLIMKNIHESCVKQGQQDDGQIDYVKGANVAAFIKIADAMIDMGVV